VGSIHVLLDESTMVISVFIAKKENVKGWGIDGADAVAYRVS
jgi:hypothetical protein